MDSNYTRRTFLSALGVTLVPRQPLLVVPKQPLFAEQPARAPFFRALQGIMQARVAREVPLLKRVAWVEDAIRKLDEGVFAAYRWEPGLADEEILARLLALNLGRSATNR